MASEIAANADSWKHEPFVEGRPIAYRASFTSSERSRIRQGLVPETMEDKWFAFMDEPHLYFHRSWTGEPVYRVTLVTEGDGAKVFEALWACHVPEPGEEAYQPHLLDFLISNLLLGKGKPFPMPPGIVEPAPGLVQHVVAGTGYPEVAAKPRRWWRFWR